MTSSRALARDDHAQIVNKWREVRTPLPANASARRKDVIRGYRRELSKLGLLNAKTEGDVRNRLMAREGERLNAAEPETIAGTGAAPPGAPPPSASRIANLTKGGVFDKDEQIVDKWREVRKPLPADTPDHRKDVIRGYRRELSKLGLLNAKTEADVRNRLMDRQGERPQAPEPETIAETGAAPPGAPPPAATRMADLTKPRPAGGVFDSEGSATMPGEVESPGGAQRAPPRARDKAGGVSPASSNDTHGAPSGAVFDSDEPSGRWVENEPASAAVEGEGSGGDGGGKGRWRRLLPNGKFYSVAFEMKLKSSSYPGKRRHHFREANEAFLRAIESDPEFAQATEQLGIKMKRTRTGEAPARSPRGWTWHHADEPGVMQLVPRSQHDSGTIFQRVLHPKGRGGYSKWGK